MNFLTKSIENSKTNLNNIVQKVKNNIWKTDNDKLFRLSVVTGDKRGSGTDSNVFLVIKDKENRCSQVLHLDHYFKNDHERGETDIYEYGEELGVFPPFSSIEVWRDDEGYFKLPFDFGNRLFFGGSNRDISDWFIDRIEITLLNNISDIPELECKSEKSLTSPESLKTDIQANKNTMDIGTKWTFPVHRWIKPHQKYCIPLYDSVLPQKDSRSEFRRQEIDEKKKDYIYAEKVKGGPIQVEHLPDDENFSEQFFWTFVQKKAALMSVSKYLSWTSHNWKSFEEMKDLYQGCLAPPKAMNCWKEDWWFSAQRLQGVNPTIIKLCREIPSCILNSKQNWGSDISEMLEGRTFEDAMNNNRIFMCNLSALEGIPCKKGNEIAVPIALFYLDSKEELWPLLIQLERKCDSPIFTPKDPDNTWVVAKMFYNNAEAQYHQSVSHLAFTHLIMEGVCAACHRNLSISHPVYRLLAPHFLYLIAINKRGEEKLVNPGGWVDSTMSQGTEGMFRLMAKEFKDWDFNQLNPMKEIKRRGLLDEGILPKYPYREDALLIYDIIKKYVQSIIRRYYDSSTDVIEDWELQNFYRELSSPFPDGIGLRGVPGTVAGFGCIADVIETVTNVISTCSVGHASANAQQYDQYGFIPNYAGILAKPPPTQKINYTEEDLVAMIPTKEVALDIIVITNLLSAPITNALGYFEVQYLFSPEDAKDAERFRGELEKASLIIAERNNNRRIPYIDLDPNALPNSISV